LLVSIPGETEVVTAAVGNVARYTSDLTDDDEVVSLDLFIVCPIEIRCGPPTAIRISANFKATVLLSARYPIPSIIPDNRS